MCVAIFTPFSFEQVILPKQCVRGEGIPSYAETPDVHELNDRAEMCLGNTLRARGMRPCVRRASCVSLPKQCVRGEGTPAYAAPPEAHRLNAQVGMSLVNPRRARGECAPARRASSFSLPKQCVHGEGIPAYAEPPEIHELDARAEMSLCNPMRAREMRPHARRASFFSLPNPCVRGQGIPA